MTLERHDFGARSVVNQIEVSKELMINRKQTEDIWTDLLATSVIRLRTAVLRKFRVVFDASCRTDRGKSLNDMQLIGEKMQEDLAPLIMRFQLCYMRGWKPLLAYNVL